MKILRTPKTSFILPFTISLILFCSTLLNAQENKIRIACIGNSITYGSHLDNPAEDSYPSQLRRMLSKTCIVNNYGVSGRNMLKNGPKPIWKEKKFTDALQWKPDICIILLGTNDSRPDLWELHGKEFFENYISMIDTFKLINPDTKFIMGAPSPIWEGHPYGGDTWGEKHNDSILVNCVIPLIEKVAKETGAALIDFHTPFKDKAELFPDRLHPNPTGANIMATMIFDILDKKAFVTQLNLEKPGSNKN